MRSIIASGLIGFAGLACVAVPTQPAPVVNQSQPSPEPPPPTTPGARAIEPGSVIHDQLTVSAVPAGCPATHFPDVVMPCRHFQVVAPSDGLLRVELEWFPRPGAEVVALIVAGADVPHINYYRNPQLRTHRVISGATYGISVVYWPSHYDYLFLGSDLIGEFRLAARFEG
jgi:hypothetical protein